MLKSEQLAPVIELGRWVVCANHVLTALGLVCDALPQRNRVGLNGWGHEHYVACGCRWDSIERSRTRLCKRHPRRGWE